MKKRNENENYLERIPVRRGDITHKTANDGIVTLEIENKGPFNRIAQKLFKKPKISYIHLDEFGSFVWTIIDGEKSIYELATEVDRRFGEKAHPLYERLSKYISILVSYGFVHWKNQ